MAPLYRHLAHPTEGVLNSLGESTSKAVSAPVPSRRGSLVSSNLLPPKKSVQSGLLPWDEALYEELKEDNEKELETIQKEEEDAEEAAGETEVQAARSKRAEFWARVGDKVGGAACCIERRHAKLDKGQSYLILRSCIRQDWAPRNQDRYRPRHHTRRHVLRRQSFHQETGRSSQHSGRKWW